MFSLRTQYKGDLAARTLTMTELTELQHTQLQLKTAPEEKDSNFNYSRPLKFIFNIFTLLLDTFF